MLSIYVTVYIVEDLGNLENFFSLVFCSVYQVIYIMPKAGIFQLLQ